MAKAKKKGNAVSTLPMAVEAPERPKMVSFEFPHGKPPEGFNNLSVGDKVTVTVTGTVTRLSQEKDWGANLSMEISKVSL